MSLKVQKVTEPQMVGEAPHWDSKNQALFFVDIISSTINKYTPSTGTHTRTKLSGYVGFIVPVEGTTDQFVVGVESKFLVVRWNGEDGSPAELVRELGVVGNGQPANINDAKADPRGRLFAGTLGKPLSPGKFAKNGGSLFRLDGSSIKKVENGVTVSNGLAWDLKEKAMYYIDSEEYNIRRYDYDVDTGEISNLKYVFDLKNNNIEGTPDGCTIDTDGNLWVAVFQGSCVLNIDPRTGKLLQKVSIPAHQVTSVAFGGPNLDVLFVTSASITITKEQKPPCGSVFMVTGLGVKGHPSVNFKL